MLMQCQTDVTGVFNAAGPKSPLTMGGLVDALQSTLPGAGTPEWVTEKFLLAHEVAEWSELPLWISEAAQSAGEDAVSLERALGQGLMLRPVTDTIRDTWEWDRARPQDTPMKAGLSADRERRLLAYWDQGA
jgi:2'-hydroxyisoflavone reductase